MSAVRNVRLLDTRPGELERDVKTVRGVRIERGVPLPKKHANGALRAILVSMEVGESFVHKARARLEGDDKITGREYTTRALPDGRFRIWRTK